MLLLVKRATPVTLRGVSEECSQYHDVVPLPFEQSCIVRYGIICAVRGGATNPI